MPGHGLLPTFKFVEKALTRMQYQTLQDRMDAVFGLVNREHVLSLSFADWYLELSHSDRDRQILILLLEMQTLVSDYQAALMDAESKLAMAVEIVRETSTGAIAGSLIH